MRLVIALVMVAQVFVCQAVLSAPSTDSSIATSQHDTGHDVVCEPGAAVAAPASPSVGRDCSGARGVGTLAALFALVALSAGGALALAVTLSRTSSRKSVAGRYRLLHLQIIRV